MAVPTPGGGTRDSDQRRPDQPRRDPGAGIMIARPFGIPIYISPFMLVFAFVLVFWYANTIEIGSARDRYIVAGSFVLLLYVSVLIHELAHCAVARGYGLPIRRVLLYPLGGYSEISQEPAKPSQEALLSAAGPAISLVLAGIGYLLARYITGGLPHQVIRQVYVANLIVGIFNLLPGLPLDGGRIFRAGIWKLTGKPVTATIAAAWAGRVLAVVMVGLALFGQQRQGTAGTWLSGYWLSLIVVAAFIWFQSTQVMRAAKIRERLPALTARRLARRAIPVPANLPLAEAIRRAQEAGARALVIADHENTPTAIVSEAAVLATPEERRPWIDAGSLARALDPGLVLSADLAGLDLIQAVQKMPATEYLLIEPTGAVFGVLATADLDHAFAGA